MALSERGQRIADWFGIDPRMRRNPTGSDIAPPSSGRIMLLTGPSGSGKSMLLRKLRRRARGIVVDLSRITLPDRAVIDLFDHVSIEEALEALGRVGLAEARTWLLPPRKLSAGQRWRLRLAIVACDPRLREGGPLCIIADEFAALLDRITAMAIARRLRKLVDAHPHASAIVATSHDDLAPALGVDVVVACDYGGTVSCQSPVAREEPVRLPGRLIAGRGSARDWGELARFHYRAGRPATWAGVWTVRYEPEGMPGSSRLAGVAVLSYPTLSLAAREAALNLRPLGVRARIDFVNAHLRTISRLVVHPAFRALGVATHLVGRILRECPTRYVEAVAAMGRAHPVFERAGMKAYTPANDRQPMYYLHDRGQPRW